MNPMTVIERIRITNLYGICGSVDIQPKSNLLILVGPNQAGKTKLLEAIQAGFGRVIEPIPANLINWYGISDNTPETRGSVELDIWTNALIPLVDRTVTTIFLRRDLSVLEDLVHVHLAQEFIVQASAPGRVKRGDARVTFSNNLTGYDWHGMSVPDATLQSLFLFLGCNEEFQLPPKVSIGDGGVGAMLLRKAWGVKTDREAIDQGKSVPRKHLADMDAKSAARLRDELPESLPPHLSIAVTRDGTKGNTADVDLYDLERRRRLDGVELSHGNRRAMLIEMTARWVNGTVLIIDEVERGLHPAQQLRILQKLRSISQEQTVIVTTHSETILRAARADELHVVDLEETPDRISTRVRPMVASGVSAMLKREFAGYSPVQGRSPVPLILVEGPTDKWYIETLVLTSKHIDWPQLRELQVTYGFGSQMVQYSRWLTTNGIKHLCLLDNDPAGLQYEKRLRGQGLSTAIMLPWEGAIEDLYFGSVLEQALKELAEDTERAAFDIAARKAGETADDLPFYRLASIYSRSTKRSVDKVRLADKLHELGSHPRADRVSVLRNALGAAVEALYQQ